MDVVRKKARKDRPLSLKTLAIGANTYGHVWMGISHFPQLKIMDYLQLRIYRVVYNHSPNGLSTTRPYLIGKGTAADAVGISENLDIFAIYWLDIYPIQEDSDMSSIAS